MVDRRSLRHLIAVMCGAALACASAPVVRSDPAPSTPPAPAPIARPEVASAGRAAPAAPAGEGGGLSFAVVPPDAEVLIDGRSFGKVADLARNGTLPLQPGLYQVSLKRSGFATWRAEVSVGAAVEPIRVTLARRTARP